MDDGARTQRGSFHHGPLVVRYSPELSRQIRRRLGRPAGSWRVGGQSGPRSFRIGGTAQRPRLAVRSERNVGVADQTRLDAWREASGRALGEVDRRHWPGDLGGPVGAHRRYPLRDGRPHLAVRQSGPTQEWAKGTKRPWNAALKVPLAPRIHPTPLEGGAPEGFPREGRDWLQDSFTSWHAMCGVRNAMSGIITKATEWEILPETYANAMRRVKLPKKWEIFEKRILSPEDTAPVLGLLEEPNLLIGETCVDTGTRISEVTGLQVRHVDLEKGTIRIEQRNWRGDIDAPKTAKSKRMLALGGLADRYKEWIAKLKHNGPDAWIFPQDEDL